MASPDTLVGSNRAFRGRLQSQADIRLLKEVKMSFLVIVFAQLSDPLTLVGYVLAGVIARNVAVALVLGNWKDHRKIVLRIAFRL